MQKQTTTSIEEHANDWLIKLETDGLSNQEEERFVEWLTANDKHGEAFHCAEQTWKLMQQSAAHNKTMKQPSRWLAMAASILLVVLSSLWWPDLYYSLSADFMTSTGERKVIMLEDGSTATLNTNSAIAVELTNQKRVVTLLKGEVYVEVASIPDNSFSVIAGDLQATALGTAFIVNMENDLGPSVVVTEHKVSVEGIGLNVDKKLLNKGQQTRLLKDRQLFTVVDEVDVSQSKGWLNGRYVFKQQSLEYVVNELKRHVNTTIIIRGDTLGDSKITGILNLDDPMTSLEDLTAPLNIKIRTITSYIVILERE